MQNNDTVKAEVDKLLKKAHELRIKNLSKSVELAEAALTISKKIGSKQLIAQSLNQLSLFQMIFGNYPLSKEYSDKALKIFKKLKDLKGIADTKYNIASIFYKTNRLFEGLQYLLDCLMIYRQFEDHHNEARVFKFMGVIYEYFGDESSAISAYENSIKASLKIKDTNLESNAYNPLSGIYLNRGKHKLAMQIIEKSIHLKEESEDIRGLAFALYGRGKIHTKLGNYVEAERDLVRSLEIHREMRECVGEGMSCHKLGAMFQQMKDYKNAKEYLQLALDIAEEYDIIFIQFRVSFILYEINKDEGNAEEALYYLEKYMATKESVINTHTFDVIKSYQAIAKVETLERETKLHKEKAEIIEQKNTELDYFFYRISHDLQGPIASLKGLNNLASIDIRDEVSKNYVGMYKKQVDRINNIITELINLTKMNHLEVIKQPIDFNLMVDDCYHSLTQYPNFNKIELIKSIDEHIEFCSEWPIVNTIFQNLIENSIKYSSTKEREPYLKVSVKKRKKYIKIIVEDNGMGIDPEHQEKVFDMFYRANDTIEGTGLGLYILKRAVERLSGQVKLESNLKLGSTFTVMLPFELK
ncbi:tetratricopeptide repeat-containing sensor histidine kinase [Fulvivirgaceae bacterium BMA10]|uniref:histidine kinase n=1 Tax=Splendidivirga corallicola TaxID=3051826 RepID=A0ABT8KVE9_9BACT|nr:tetratricopeptide repeat-containing sensor histidine kinase [Fulvivirgaceae bacterium BMA10]